MIDMKGIKMDDGVDELNERDEDLDDESPLGPEGCLFPGQCCMPGPHYESECHTPEMLMAQEAEVASAPNVKVSDPAPRALRMQLRRKAGFAGAPC